MDPSASEPRDADVQARPKRRVWGTVGSVAAIVVGVAAVGAGFVHLPYVLISPGDATRVEKVVDIEGAPTYHDDGSVLFLTVSVSGARPNVYTVLSGWLDDDVEVVPEEDILGGRSRKEDERLNEIAMTDSQIVATKVGLERLGYAVPVKEYVVGAFAKASPADGQLEVGDAITAIDGVPVTTIPDLGANVRMRNPGDPVTLAFTRDGTASTVTLATRATPEGPNEGQAQVGIFSAPTFDFPIDVKIDTGDVGGPSAGLAFTLTILDELSPGDLTGGEKVAVTGTIGLDGSVGPIGGVAQKAVAARQAGAHLFLVPRDEAKEARKHADGMKVSGVADLGDALSALQRAGGDPLPSPTVTAA